MCLPTPAELHLRESWVFQGAETAVARLVRTPLRAGRDRLVDWDDAMERVRQGHVCTPVDLRSFDHLPSSLVVDRAQELLAFLCGPPNEDPDWESSWCPILEWVRSVSFRVPGVEEVIHYKKGVASGWRCTAALDTLLSAALVKGLCSLTRIDPPGFVRSQGDDVEAIWEREGDARTFVEALGRLGVANPSKGWVSTSRSELLRVVTTEGSRSAYPLRPLAALLQPLPWVGGVHDPLARVDGWSSLAARGRASIKWKIRVYDAVIVTKLMYGLTSIPLSRADANKLDAFQMRIKTNIES